MRLFSTCVLVMCVTLSSTAYSFSMFVRPAWLSFVVVCVWLAVQLLSFMWILPLTAISLSGATMCDLSWEDPLICFSLYNMMKSLCLSLLTVLFSLSISVHLCPYLSVCVHIHAFAV